MKKIACLGLVLSSSLIAFGPVNPAPGNTPPRVKQTSLDKCPAWARDPKNLPLCPEHGLLSSEYPALAHVISETNHPASSARAAERDRIADLAKKLLVYSGDRPPLIFLNVTEDVRKDVEAAVSKLDVSPERKQTYLDSLRWIPPAVAEPQTWVQDDMESFVDPATGRATVRVVQEYGSKATARVQAMEDACPLIQEGPPLRGYPTKGGGNSEMGGNIEFAPFGVCLVGNNQNPAYSRQFCHDRDKVVVPTDFLEVGHVDEVISVHKFDQPKCKVVVAAASYAKARQLLEARRHQTLFDFFRQQPPEKLADRRKWIEEQIMTLGEHFEPFCRHFEREPSAYREASESRLSPPESLQNDTHLSAAPKPEGPRDPKVRVPCHQALVGDLLGYLNDRHNKEVDRRIQASTKTLIQRLRERAPAGCEIVQVDLPQIVDGKVSFLPNPSNLVRSGDTLVLPDPGSDVLRDHLQTSFAAHQVPVTFTDSLDLHVRDGNLHCASNTIRLCRPNPDAKVVPIPMHEEGFESIPVKLDLVRERKLINRFLDSKKPEVRMAIYNRFDADASYLPTGPTRDTLDHVLERARTETVPKVMSEALQLDSTLNPGKYGLLRSYLSSTDPKIRAGGASVAFRVLRGPDPEAFEVAREMLRHRDPNVVAEGIYVARNLSLPDHDPMAYFATGATPVRVAVLKSLRHAPADDPVRLALAASLDRDPVVRREAFDLLRHDDKNASAVALVENGLKDADDSVRARAAVVAYDWDKEKYRDAFVKSALHPKHGEELLLSLFDLRRSSLGPQPADLKTMNAIVKAAAGDKLALRRIVEAMRGGEGEDARTLLQGLDLANRAELVPLWNVEDHLHYLMEALYDTDPKVWKPATRTLARDEAATLPHVTADLLRERLKDLNK